MGHKTFVKFLAKNDISHSECAQRLGVERMTVWRWVRGRSKPSPFARQAIKAKIGFVWPEEGKK